MGLVVVAAAEEAERGYMPAVAVCEAIVAIEAIVAVWSCEAIVGVGEVSSRCLAGLV